MTPTQETILESAALTRFRTQGYVDLKAVIRLLNHAKISFVLVGQWEWRVG